jgi:two-component system chemotaxis response regulator CheB
MTGSSDPATPRRRVLVVDDSTFMRMVLRRIVEAGNEMIVVGEARNGREAVELARRLKPDIITMDVEMPELDGLSATQQILAGPPPTPILIMVSGHTQHGTEATIKALSLGAVDFVSKSSSFAAEDFGHVDSELSQKLRYWAGRTAPLAEPRDAARPAASPPTAASGTAMRPLSPRARPDLVVVASSTGGPQILSAFLRAAAPLGAPMVIAQHMPAQFTLSLATLLRSETSLDVREGVSRMKLYAGTVTIIPGGQDAIVASVPTGYELRLTTHDSLVHPCADLLFETAALVARHPVAVILTGMGNDGTRGAEQFRRRQLPVLVQDPKSCVVGGMPAAAIEAGVATESLTPVEIGQRLALWTSPSYAPRTRTVETQ